MRIETAAAGRLTWAVYLAIALSGLAALGAEVVWTRLLSLMLGARSTRSRSSWRCF